MPVGLKLGIVVSILLCGLGTSLALNGLVGSIVPAGLGFLGLGLLIGGVVGTLLLARHAWKLETAELDLIKREAEEASLRAFEAELKRRRNRQS